jgi:TPP-dependent indolepyruvate ferredoxin oxidoreductase alpha subunit
VIHLALYVIEDSEDAILSAKNGIFDFVIDDSECENCGMVIGPVKEHFFPCIVIVDTDDKLEIDRWAICIDCAAPLVYPNEWTINLEL